MDVARPPYVNDKDASSVAATPFPTPDNASDSDKRRLEEALRYANVPTLLMLLVQLTGNLKWLDDPYRPQRTRGISDGDSGGLPEEAQDAVRLAALNAILDWKAGTPVVLSELPADLLLRMMRVSTGEDVPDEYAAMMATELSGPRPEPMKSAVVPKGFRVVIVGAGVSGICAGVYLEAAGVPYIIFEREAALGGTWLSNQYPGVGVDTPNHLYSFSFAPHDWRHYYASGGEVREYLEKVASDHGVSPHIQTETSVVAADYDEKAQEWTVTVQRSEGTMELVRCNVLITAAGAFNRPKAPSIPGLERFSGPVFHAAQWPDDLDVTGTRVAVVGNGATAMQVVPAIVDDAASVTVFQRSPQWVVPFEKFRTEIPEGVRYLFEDVPLYAKWYRLRLGWIHNDRLWPALQRDPSWAHPERSVNAVNDIHRQNLTDYVRSELAGDEALIEAVLPSYPPFGKRILLDNGWFRALARADTELVTESIVEVDEDSVVTTSGTHFPADVLVLATGYDVVRFLATIDVHGRSGRSLREAWEDDNAKAYLGVAIPDFPNLFCIYGPNSQPGHGGSIMFITECQTHYILSAIEQMLAGGLGAVEVRPEVHDAYNLAVDEAHAGMVWTHPGMTTYYRNDRGRIVVNNPFRVVDYWHMTRAADLTEYVTEPAGASHNVRQPGEGVG